jgi:hypothetical protein
MAKFYGPVGYAETKETSPGVWTENIIELNYSGDVIKNSKLWKAGENLNDNLNVNNQISILADTFAYQNFHLIRYVKWMGACWKISRIDVLWPRLILTLGGVYNGGKAPITNTP